MERIKERYAIFLSALTTLEKSLNKFTTRPSNHEDYEELRDSVIQRYEYTIDTFWKFLKSYLEVIHGTAPVGSPKAVIKNAFDVKIVSPQEYEQLIRMIDDRNLTSHAYNIDVAEEISEAIP